MTNKVLGGGALDGNLGLNPDFSTLTIPLGRVVQSVDNEGYIQYWIIEETLKAGGNALANGLYANSTTLKEVAGGVSKLSVQNRQAIEATYKAQGYNNVFFFEDGFTYTEPNDVGIYEDGTAWTYADAGALPVTIAAGTVPSEGVYKSVKLSAQYMFFNDETSIQEFGDFISQDDSQIKASSNDFNKVAALASTGSLVAGCVGDSIMAGVGAGSANTYAQCSTDYGSGWSSFLWYNLINTDSNFTKPNPSDPYYSLQNIADSQFLSMPFEGLYLNNLSRPESVKTRVVQARRAVPVPDRLTVYHGVQTSDDAAVFDLVVLNDAGAEIHRESIDTYRDPIDFGVATENVGMRMFKTTFSLPQARRSAYAYIENLTAIDRGNGLSDTARAYIYGYALGSGVDLMNFAVSSTTLLNNSSANQSRGVTTDERLQKLYDNNVNAVFINWGTNDSKSGVSTTEAFEADLKTRVAEIRAYKEGIPIILLTAPAGVSGSQYEDNVEYNKIIREVAFDTGCALFDGEKLSNALGSQSYNDDVHPSAYGYMAYTGALSNLCCAIAEKPFIKQNSFTRTLESGVMVVPSTSNVGGALIEVFSQSIPRPDGLNTINIFGSVNVVSSGDIIAASVVLKINGATMDTKEVSSPAVRDVDFVVIEGASLSVPINRSYETAGGASYTISIEISNCGIKSANSTSRINFLWTD